MQSAASEHAGLHGEASTACTHSPSASSRRVRQVSLVAAAVAHEIGHNLGLEHDTASCECPEAHCVMSAAAR